MPQVYLIGGPNGAGKTTSAFQLMLDELVGIEFVNADIIAARLNPQAPETAAFQAGRLMLERLEQLAASGSDFIFESTLATRSFAPFLIRCQEVDYIVNLLYFWLASPEIAIERVAERVRAGGHTVPPEDIRRRYNRSILNLRELYIPLADGWYVYDNSLGLSRRVAEGSRSGDVIIHDAKTWQLLAGGQDV